MENEESKEYAFELLKLALAEAQQSVRSYDSKAQICGVGYIFSLNIVFGINKIIWPVAEVGFNYLVVVWLLFILPIMLFGYVLYPTRKGMYIADQDDAKDVNKILYVKLDDFSTIKKLTDAALISDPLQELAFELFKSSGLRDRKRKRFVVALIVSLISFVLMFLFQFSEVLIQT